MNKGEVVLAGTVMVAVLALASCRREEDAAKVTAAELFAMRSASSEVLAGHLYSPKSDLVMSALYNLTKRGDPIGIPRARELLISEDDYTWLNAALYLGSLGEPEAVPYLIKALRHPASRSYEESAEYLEALSGQSHGTDQALWLAWWEESHPQSGFDFSYPALRRRAEALDSESHICINDVFGPTTLGFGGVRIALIGVKLRDGADPAAATGYLKHLVLGQWVRLSFDDGPAFDAEGRRRAFVYWVRGSNDPFSDAFLREGLLPAPFTEPTQMNDYLLSTELYEPDTTIPQGQ